MQTNGDFLSLNPRPTKHLDDSMGQLFRHLHQGELIRYFNGADDIRIQPGLVGNGANEVSRADASRSAGAEM